MLVLLALLRTRVAPFRTRKSPVTFRDAETMRVEALMDILMVCKGTAITVSIMRMSAGHNAEGRRALFVPTTTVVGVVLTHVPFKQVKF